MTAPANFLKGSAGGQQVIAGKIGLTSAGVLTGATSGNGWSVADDSADDGLYEITLSNSGRPILACVVGIEFLDEDIGYAAQVKSITASTGVVIVRTVAADETEGGDGGALSLDVTKAAFIHFVAVLG